MIVPLRWCDSKIVVGTYGKGTGDNLPDEVRWFPSCFRLPFLVLICVIGNLGEDELRGDADLDQVLHNFAEHSNTVHSLQIGFQLRPSSLSHSTKCPLPGWIGSHLVGHLHKVEAWTPEGDHVTSRPWMLHRFESGEVHGSSWCTPTCFPIRWCTPTCKTQEPCDCSEMPVGQRSSCRWCTCPRTFWLRCSALPGSWSAPGAGGTVWSPPPRTGSMAPYLSSRPRPPRLD